jgi:hypothetical protein
MSIDRNIISLRESLEARLSDVLKIIEINDFILKLVTSNLNSIKTDLTALGKGGGLIGKLDNSVKLLGNITSNSDVVAQKGIITEQVIVLFIGSFESYLNDVIRTVGNEQPELFVFQDPNEKITFSQTMLGDGFTLGDAILEHIDNKGYSFQDLKSTLDVFEKYLGISISITDDERDTLILTAALRHIIIHKSSKVDRPFLKQIRNTQYKTKYKIDESIKFDDSLIQKSKESILAFADQVTAALLDKSQDDIR